MDVPEFTKNIAKNKVLLMLAYTVRASREVLMLLVGSYVYLNKILHEMKDSGLITMSKTRPQIVSLTAAAVELIKGKDTATYEHYMKISNGHHPGSTSAHKARYEMAATAISRLYLLDVAVGAMKPTLCEVLESGYKLPTDFCTFYQSKEIVYTDLHEKQQTKSRSVGILFTPAWRAVVYIMAPELMVAGRSEHMEHLLANRTFKELYGACDDGSSTATLVIGKDALELARRLREPRKHKGFQSIATAVGDRNFTGGDLIFCPTGQKLQPHFYNAMRLPYHTILSQWFGEEAHIQGKIRGCGAYSNGFGYFEFLSFNASKLARAKKFCPTMDRVRIVCWPEQREFITEFLELSDEVANAILIAPDEIPCME